MLDNKINLLHTEHMQRGLSATQSNIKPSRQAARRPLLSPGGRELGKTNSPRGIFLRGDAMKVREQYNSETLDMLMDLNNRLSFAHNKIKNGETMESIPGYDQYKLSDGVDPLAEAEVDALERGLLLCPFCNGAAMFEDAADGKIYASCRECGANVYSIDFEGAAKLWNLRAPNSASKLPTQKREYWTGY